MSTLDVLQRVRIYRVTPEDILSLLDWYHGDHISCPAFPELPEGSRVVSIKESWERRAFELLVYNPEFDKVPEGQAPPDDYDMLSVRSVWLKKSSDDTFIHEDAKGEFE